MPHLTDQSKWYLLKTDTAVRPFIFQDREPVEFGALMENADEGFKREKFLFGVRARYRMAYGYWQNAIRMDLI
jgi:phage major head subunit gpT-like protein